MKNKFLLLFTCVAAIFNTGLLAQPTDIFISEYVEGSSFNKAIELYNGTNAAINLSTGQYVIEVYFNGSTSSTSLALTGSIPAGSVFIVAHPSATLGVTPDLSSSVINFNGNDAVVLKKGGSVLDVIGYVGINPGTQWGSNDTSTLDRTLRRKILICQGDIITSNPFFPSLEWDGFPINTFNGLGAHTTQCVAPGSGISVAPSVLSFTTLANVPSTPLVFAITGTSLVSAVNINAPAFFEISLLVAGPFSASLSIPSQSFNAGPLNIYARYLPTTTGNNSGTVQINSSPFTATMALTGVCIGITPIAVIQGSNAASSFTGQLLATEGIVTADFQGTNELGGFFIQDPIGDNNPLTSEGIFVFNTSYSVNVGDKVQLSGLVDEFFGKTQIKSLSSLTVQSTGNSALSPVTVLLPFASATEAEKWEGMRVQFTQTLTVTEVFTLGRFGEVSLSINGRLFTPTNFVDPNDQPASGTSSTGTSNVAAVIAQQNVNNLSRILLDDKSSVQNPAIVPYVDPTNNTLRCGSTLANLNGIMDYDFGVYRIQPVISPNFTYATRPTVPDVGTANVKLASFNVLNYFNGNGTGGGFPTSRGANTALEFSRQRTKIIEAIKQINADALGLMEMENDGNGPQSAIADLVDGLNVLMGAGTYTYVVDPTTVNGGTGTDEIKVAMIYKPSVLTCTGLATADNNVVHNRPPLAQTFIHNTSQEKFSVIVNHFKSKGCSGATGNNVDQNDGQSCFNESRKLQATALLNFVTTIKNQSSDNDVIVMGDINAYEQEDPIDILLAGGMTHLLNNTYSYVFNGQSGSLDHALVSASLNGQVSGAAKWHINADEPICKDYNQEFNPAYMYDPGPYRSSDHDPLIVGLDLKPVTTGIENGSTLNAIGSFFTIMPNPASHADINLTLNSNSSKSAEITLRDQLGKIVYNQTSNVSSGQNTVFLSLPVLNSGVYFVSVKMDGLNQTQKLLILK